MKTLNKLAVGAALLGAITTAQAEPMVFGAVVDPIMSLEVDGRMVPADALLAGSTNAAGIAPATDDAVVGAFRVTTNVVKWNVKMSLENGGILKSWGGSPLKTNGNVAAGQVGKIGLIAAAADKLFITLTSVNGAAATALLLTGVVDEQADLAGGAIAALEAGFSEDDFLTSLDAALVNGYYFNKAKNTLAFEVKTCIDGTAITALAGTYTETLNLSLYGSY